VDVGVHEAGGHHVAVGVQAASRPPPREQLAGGAHLGDAPVHHGDRVAGQDAVGEVDEPTTVDEQVAPTRRRAGVSRCGRHASTAFMNDHRCPSRSRAPYSR
jgi:hypothetical protein